VNAGAGAPNLSQGSIPVVADFNGEGCDDIAIVWPQTSGVFIYYSRSDGTFYLGAILDTVGLVGGLPGASAATFGDFDGDRRPDIAVGLADTQQVVVFFNWGNGQFARAFFASGASAIGLASADLVQKGKTDLVIANYNLSFRPPNVNVMFHK
jgi:FG-GAP-like repeat